LTAFSPAPKTAYIIMNCVNTTRRFTNEPLISIEKSFGNLFLGFLDWKNPFLGEKPLAKKPFLFAG
jgi:hypothetical protein